MLHYNNLMLNKISKLTITIFLIFGLKSSVNADVNVVTSIKPIHSLASYVMDGVGKPDVIVDGYNSPHGFSLKPSHAKMIEKADLIIWVGEDLEAFLEKPLNTIAKKAVNVEIMDLSGIKNLSLEKKNIFEGHDDHGHGHKEKNMTIMGMGIKRKNMTITDMVIKKRNTMIMVIKKLNMMITGMRDMLTVNTIHMFG